MNWPSQSPDLNPIEHLWDEIGRRLRNITTSNATELFRTVQKIWNKIPVTVCQKLVDSMPRRCQAVLEAKGYATKY